MRPLIKSSSPPLRRPLRKSGIPGSPSPPPSGDLPPLPAALARKGPAHIWCKPITGCQPRETERISARRRCGEQCATFSKVCLRGTCRRQRGSPSQGLSGHWRRTPPCIFAIASGARDASGVNRSQGVSLAKQNGSPLGGGDGEIPNARLFQRSACGGRAEGRGVPHLKVYLVTGGGPPLCHSVTSPPARRPLNKSPSPPLRGRCRRQRGVPHLQAYLVAGGGPPLCHSVTSPPARGGEGNHEFFKGLRKGGREWGTRSFNVGLRERARGRAGTP